MSRIPLIFGIASVLVGLSAIGYVYETDPVRRAMACAAAVEDPCVARGGHAIAETIESHPLELVAVATAATTIDGAP